MAKTLSLRFKDTPDDQARAKEIIEALRENIRVVPGLPDGQVAIIQPCPYCKTLIPNTRGRGCESCGGLGVQGAIIDNVAEAEECTDG